ncbi:hypothetical protein DC522_08070 [Microvirga sp. KLBC 81]|uniref:DUF488 domain-containing protein n=1 Tax=Microvirga sp. KLBC 81 TaxID=1862707 RepID=UPI000D517D4A|nr:DUF488 domain-containing protein [Microvirga sp. KLBC 81]PVE24870.1 hypothetical protein DC522_08070 [Microvirga sp. KLBC 81]
MAKPQVFTIGYEGADVDRFLTTLEDAGVETLADVRAVALSRKRGFSKSALRDALATQGIGYEHFIKLGTPKEGRQAARAGDGELMRRIYCDEVLATEEAQAAFRDLETLAAAKPICLLCFERDPANCHRRVLARRLEGLGFETVDLMVL